LVFSGKICDLQLGRRLLRPVTHSSAAAGDVAVTVAQNASTLHTNDIQSYNLN
jgi:hypothetical protein